jgi:uncharacterized protein YbjQ (UPF0145 family)
VRKETAVKLTIVPILLGACGAGNWADQVQVSKLPLDEQKAALSVRVFDQTMQPPTAKEIVGEIQAVSCQNKPWQPPSTKGDALSQLRVKAWRLGADAVTGVTYTERDTTYKPNCWNSVIVSGTAVKLRNQDGHEH